MSHFFSCDWGTTSFRLRLIDAENLKILAEVSNMHGCALTHREWLGQKDTEKKPYPYYIRKIESFIQEIRQQLKLETDYIPLVISGMASSTIGMINLPYKDVPFLIDGSDLLIKNMDATQDFPHQTIIISGIRTADDVMRGEETKLIGCIDNDNKADRIIILPGTHPKHVHVAGNKIVSFKTYMTGEFFELLSQKSLLALSVKESSAFDAGSFAEGVKRGATGQNILHSSFLVRTNLLFEKYTPEQNFNYLSGLLLGSELKDTIHLPNPILLSSGNLGQLYQRAFDILKINLTQIVDADEALIRGQLKLLKKLDTVIPHNK